MAQLFSDSEQEMVAGRLGKKIRIQSIAQPMYLFNLNKTQNLMYSNIQNVQNATQNCSAYRSKIPQVTSLNIQYIQSGKISSLLRKDIEQMPTLRCHRFHPPGDLPDPGIKPRSSALQADSLLTELQGKPVGIMKGP